MYNLAGLKIWQQLLTKFIFSIQGNAWINQPTENNRILGIKSADYLKCKCKQCGYVTKKYAVRKINVNKHYLQVNAWADMSESCIILSNIDLFGSSGFMSKVYPCLIELLLPKALTCVRFLFNLHEQYSLISFIPASFLFSSVTDWRFPWSQKVFAVSLTVTARSSPYFQYSHKVH